MKEIMSLIHVKVPDRIHQVARVRAAECRTTLRQYIITLILADVERQTAAKSPEPQGDNA